MTPARILIFARAPVAGRTKTRLIPALGADGAARLHTALVRHALAAAAAAQPHALELWTTDEGGGDGASDDAGRSLAALAHAAGARVHAQPAGDLGARMAHALRSATADGRPAIVIGSDCPWLTAPVLRAAGARLAAADAVLGPAHDGGYVLLGLHRVVDSVFADVDWGTDRVLTTTRARLRAAGWRWRELPARPDVDRPEDLAALAALGGDWARLAQPSASRRA